MTNLANDLSLLSAAARSFLEKEHKLLINGQWVAPISNQKAPVFDPSSDEVIAHISYGDGADVDLAVAAAREAFEKGPWATMAPQQREQLMWRLADLIDQHAEDMGQIETVDNGMPVFVATNLNVRGAAGVLRYMAGWASKIHGKTSNIVAPFPNTEFTGYTLKEPVGVVGAIVPWNVPLMLTIWKLAPALAAGCTVVLKPAEDTSLTALRLGELICEAGFPDGVVNIVTGQGSVAGDAIVNHPGVDKISFTGSTATGKHVNRAATENVKRVTLELGGKSPNIIFDDANLEDAIRGSAMAMYANSGQICVSASRLYVQRSVYDQVVEGIASFAKSMKLGPGLDPQSQLGPMVTKQHHANVMSYIKAGVAEGADLVTGGKALAEPGYYVEPTILGNAKHDMKVVQEEIFGPVLVAAPFDDIEEVTALANGTKYGLAGYVWTNNISRAHTMVRRIRSGKIMVNTEGFPHPALPEGGFKESGFGKDLGYEAIEGFLETKSVLLRTS